MIRYWISSVLCVLMLAGCTFREEGSVQTTASGSNVTTPGQPAIPQGNPHGTLQGGATPQGNPHGMFPGGTMPQGNPHGIAQGEALTETLGPKVDLGTMHLEAPKSWTRKQRLSNITLADFKVPAAEGDTNDGRLTVSRVGGGVELNVSNWKRQFGEKPEKESQEVIDIGGIPVTVVDFSGNYGGSHAMGMGAPAAEQAGQRMLGAIFSIDGQQYVLKCSGTEKTMAEHAEEFHAFVRSLAPNPPDEPDEPAKPNEPDTSGGSP